MFETSRLKKVKCLYDKSDKGLLIMFHKKAAISKLFKNSSV